MTTLEEDPKDGNEESLENLKSLLGFERISFSNKIAKGVYEQEADRVRITATVGKWNIGHFEDSINYLKPFEALLQVEMGKLVVSFGSVGMSLEQAYANFLNEISLEEYSVYSYLMRAGYLVYHHDFEKDRLKYEAMQNKKMLNKEDEMIWCVLKEKLDLPFAEKFFTEEFQLYADTKRAMEEISAKISGRDGDLQKLPVDKSERHKRDLSPQESPQSKRLKTANDDERTSESFLDVLKTETEYFAYEDIFKSFSFIKRAEVSETFDCSLKFHFDVFSPKNNFKRTEDLPSYRLIVIK